VVYGYVRAPRMLAELTHVWTWPRGHRDQLQVGTVRARGPGDRRSRTSGVVMGTRGRGHQANGPASDTGDADTKDGSLHGRIVYLVPRPATLN